MTTSGGFTWMTPLPDGAAAAFGAAGAAGAVFDATDGDGAGDGAGEGAGVAAGAGTITFEFGDDADEFEAEPCDALDGVGDDVEDDSCFAVFADGDDGSEFTDTGSVGGSGTLSPCELIDGATGGALFAPVLSGRRALRWPSPSSSAEAEAAAGADEDVARATAAVMPPPRRNTPATHAAMIQGVWFSFGGMRVMTVSARRASMRGSCIVATGDCCVPVRGGWMSIATGAIDDGRRNGCVKCFASSASAALAASVIFTGDCCADWSVFAVGF